MCQYLVRKVVYKLITYLTLNNQPCTYLLVTFITFPKDFL